MSKTSIILHAFFPAKQAFKHREAGKQDKSLRVESKELSQRLHCSISPAHARTSPLICLAAGLARLKRHACQSSTSHYVSRFNWGDRHSFVTWEPQRECERAALMCLARTNLWQTHATKQSQGPQHNFSWQCCGMSDISFSWSITGTTQHVYKQHDCVKQQMGVLTGHNKLRMWQLAMTRGKINLKKKKNKAYPDHIKLIRKICRSTGNW